MSKLYIPILLLSLTASPAFSEFNSILCKVDNIMVETKDSRDCNSIGGVALKNYIFVINFDTGSFDGKKLRLNGNGSSNVIYFTDRPDRESGHMSVGKFKSILTKGVNGLNSGPPNATLSLIVNSKNSDSALTISNPTIDKNSIIFDVTLIKGSPPEVFNTGGLFIDHQYQALEDE